MKDACIPDCIVQGKPSHFVTFWVLQYQKETRMAIQSQFSCQHFCHMYHRMPTELVQNAETWQVRKYQRIRILTCVVMSLVQWRNNKSHLCNQLPRSYRMDQFRLSLLLSSICTNYSVTNVDNFSPNGMSSIVDLHVITPVLYDICPL